MGEVDKYKELIAREIVERPISVRALAKEIKISYQTIYAILHRKHDTIKTTTKLKLDSHFGIAREPTHKELQARVTEFGLILEDLPGTIDRTIVNLVINEDTKRLIIDKYIKKVG